MKVVTIKSPAVARDHEGHPLDWAWPGGYPVFHITSHGDVLCPSCARFAERYGSNDLPAGSGVNWEEPELFCDDCGERIESAYAEPEEE